MNVVSSEAVPGGYMITVEVPAAYTNGASRFDRVFVAAAAVRGKSPDQVRQAVLDAAMEDPIGGVIGEVAPPAETRETLEERMIARYETWQRWRNTRVEAEARGVAAPVVTALSGRENAAWNAYSALLLAWWNAP
jgi:hypothetical protein